MQEKEDEDHDAQQRRDREQEAADEVTNHGLPAEFSAHQPIGPGQIP
jgi:hypothetical protein